MNRADQIREIKVLMELAANSATALDASEMVIDASLFTDKEIHKRQTDTLFRVRQNWKSPMEGYHEFYHFSVLHPNTIAAMACGNCGIFASSST